MLRWTFRPGTLADWPADLDRTSEAFPREMGIAVREILDRMYIEVLDAYENRRYHGTKPMKYTGMTGSTLRRVTRGTGTTQGRIFGTLSIGGHAPDLARGFGSGDEDALALWAEKKLEMNPVGARAFAQRLLQKNGRNVQAIDILYVALDENEELEAYATARVQAAVDRAFQAAMSGASF